MTAGQKTSIACSAPASADHRGGSPGQAAPVHVLIAENNETNKYYVESVLDELKFTYKTVENGLAVVESYQASQPRIILMDIAMPLCDGVEATINIRRHEKRNKLHPVPIIALSANAIPGLRERYLKAGMDDYLLKPYSIEQISQKLTQWILPESNGAVGPLSQPKADMFAGD